MTKLDELERRLKGGEKLNRIRVRKFLEYFGAERRGQRVVEQIRSELSRRGLITDPDFESVWIGDHVRLRLVTEPPAGAQGVLAQAPVLRSGTFGVDSGELDEDSPGAEGDEAPIITGQEGIVETKFDQKDSTFRIGDLALARKTLVTVGEDDTLERAITLMLQREFSQLPIMQGDRKVKGVITWKSIAERVQIRGACRIVRDCRYDAQVVDSKSRFFDVIPVIARHGYVLVRGEDRRILGIVTTGDLGAQLQETAEPFLLVREIELNLRQILNAKVNEEDLAQLNHNNGKALTCMADATLGDYVYLLENPTIWSRLDLKVDRKAFVNQIDRVRAIRNDLMHFDPDPMTAEDLAELRAAANFIERLFTIRQPRLGQGEA